MVKWLIGICAGALLAGGSVVTAQTKKEPAPSAAPVTATAPTTPPAHTHTHPTPPAGADTAGRGMTGNDMPAGGGMGHGMMGGGMANGGAMMGGMGIMGGMCPMMTGSASKLEVKKLPKGVSITITSDDLHAVARIQKMAEAMRLMHEATTE